MPRKILAVFVLLSIFLFALAALAQPVPDPKANPGGFAQVLFAAIQAKQWHAVISLVLVGAVAGIRFLKPSWNKDRIGAILALVGGIALALAVSALAGTAASFRWVFDGVFIGASAAGGYSLVKKIVWPKDA